MVERRRPAGRYWRLIVFESTDTWVAKYLNNARLPKSFNEAYVESFYPKINKTDIDNGYIVRYFVKQVNHISVVDILEIDQQTYDRLSQNSMYQAIKIHWKISGSVDDTTFSGVSVPGVKNGNIRATQEADKEMPGLKYKLLNPLQFYKG